MDPYRWMRQAWLTSYETYQLYADIGYSKEDAGSYAR